MVRKIKFPLIMKNEIEVRNIEELKENFDLESTIEYFFNGKLITWLEQRSYIEELELILKLKNSDNHENISKKICEIFNVEVNETVDINKLKELKERERKLLEYTDDEEWKEKLEFIAFNQEELDELVNKKSVIYLVGEEFSVSNKFPNKEYIGINRSELNLEFEERYKDNEKTITFKNVELKSDSKIDFNCKVDDVCIIDTTNINTKSKYIRNIKSIDLDRISSDINLADRIFLVDDNIIYHFLNKIKVVNLDTLKITKERNDMRIDNIIKNQGKIIILGKEEYEQNKGVIILNVKNLNKIKSYYNFNNFNIKLWSHYDNCLYDKKYSLDHNSGYIMSMYNNILNVFCYDQYNTLIWIKIDINLGEYIGNRYLEKVDYRNKFDIDSNMLYVNNETNIIKSFDQETQLEEPNVYENEYMFKANYMGNFVVCRDYIITTWGCPANNSWEQSKEVFGDLDDNKKLFLGFIGVYDIKTGKEIQLFKAHEATILIIKKVKEKDMLITVDKKMILKLWNINDFKLIGQISLCNNNDEIAEQLEQLDLAMYKERFFIVDYDELTDKILIKYYNKVFILG